MAILSRLTSLRWWKGLIALTLYGYLGASFPTFATAHEIHIHPPSGYHPAISIIIDDLGKLMPNSLRAVRLPSAVTCAFLPHRPYSYGLAILAHQLGKEVMLHLPMESMDHRPLGSGGLTLDMTRQEATGVIRHDMDMIPYVSGINNHMGSLLTQHPGYMQWVMEEIRHHGGGIFFVDSRTTNASVAFQLASENKIPHLKRNIFLDNERDPHSILHQFHRLLGLAREQGTALAIGHPYPETLEVLEREIPGLAEEGVELVAASELVKRQNILHHLRMASLTHHTPSSSSAGGSAVRETHN